MIVGSMQENAVKTNFNKFNEVLLKLRFKEVFRNLVIHIDWPENEKSRVYIDFWKKQNLSKNSFQKSLEQN